MAKIEYDIDPDLIVYKTSRYTKYAQDFLKTDHQNMSIEFDTVDDAIGAAKSISTWRGRNEVYNLEIRRRKNIVVLIRSEHGDKG